MAKASGDRCGGRVDAVEELQRDPRQGVDRAGRRTVAADLHGDDGVVARRRRHGLGNRFGGRLDGAGVGLGRGGGRLGSVVVVSATFGSSAAKGVPPTVPSRCTTESATTWPDTSASISHRRGRGEQAAGERLRHDDGLRVDDVPHDVGPGRGVDRDRAVEEHLPAVAVDVDDQRALLGRRGIDGDAADLGQVGGVDRPDARTVAIPCGQVHVGAGQPGAGDGAAVGRRRRQRGLQLGERAAPGGEVGEDATEGALERARRGDGLRLLRPVGAELGIGGDVGAGGQHGHATVDRGRLEPHRPCR